MSTEEKYTDNTIMPFGKHKGKKLCNVPDSYLLWIYKKELEPGPLKAYIIDNLDTLKK